MNLTLTAAYCRELSSSPSSHFLYLTWWNEQRSSRLCIKLLTNLVERSDTPGRSLESCFGQVRPHVADDVLHQLVHMLVKQVTWNIVSRSTSHIYEPIPCDLMGFLSGFSA